MSANNTNLREESANVIEEVQERVFSSIREKVSI